MARIAFHSSSTAMLSFEDDLKLAKLTGYNGIVCAYGKMHEYLETGNQKDLKSVAKDANVAIFGIANIPVDLREVGEETVREVKRCARLVRAMKGNFVSITPTRFPADQADEEALMAEYTVRLAAVAEGAAEYGVQVAVEMEEPHRFLTNPVKISYIISRAGRDNLGFVLDTFAFWRAGVSIEEMETIERHFSAVYLADAPDKDRKKLKESDRLPLGEGVIDMERVLRVICKSGYKGVFTIKLHGENRTKQKYREMLKEARENLQAHLEIMTYL
ncbi:MAG: sugar phosphate isomerase/epimerase family protein [Planctomycetota bacterium]